MNKYPPLTNNEYKSILDWINNVQQQRSKDVTDWDSLLQTYIHGRNRTYINDRNVPTSSADTAVTDAEGDVMYDTNYLYILVNNSGTLVWRRVALAAW